VIPYRQINHPRAVPAPGDGNYFNNVTPSHLALPQDYDQWRWGARTNPY
jgi:hypothetical protein